MSAAEAARPLPRAASAGGGRGGGGGGVDGEAEGDAYDGVEERELASFEAIDDFRVLLADFLNTDGEDNDDGRDGGGDKVGDGGSQSTRRSTRAEAPAPNPYRNPTIAKMLDMLAPYQEQPYLLDPYLDELVLAPVQALQRIIRATHTRAEGLKTGPSLASRKLQELAVLIYWYTKIRGDKVITRFFPHEVDDLLPVIVSLEDLNAGKEMTKRTVWELRYVLLLWLSLVCMIPFDLQQLDKVASQSSSGSIGSVAERIETLGRTFLASPGKERDASAVMLGKLFQRRDLKDAALARFLEWSKQVAMSDDATSFLQTGIMQALCEIIKVSDPASVAQHLPVLQDLFDTFDSSSRGASSSVGSSVAAGNMLILRYEAKMACRLGLKLLRPRRVRRTKESKALDANLRGPGDPDVSESSKLEQDPVVDTEDEDEEDIPEEIDQFVSKLLTCLESKDTAVRYSAAKGLARLCERFPPSFVAQLTDAIRSLFAINVIERGENDVDLSSASEHTWQGACMAIAELARRGLLDASELPETMKWILRALTFDVRRGANSVGSAVRDAACYVLWALARAHSNAEALRPYATAMATRLLIVATLDREVSIRRAASAAFQECVGRMGNIPHGIDVLRKTDFYAVGVRRNAFVFCAPEVAQHDVYLRPLLEHLLSVTISHWDRSMRSLAAESIRALVGLDFDGQAAEVSQRLLVAVKKPDSFTVHGSLLALSQLAELCVEHRSSVKVGNVLQACLDALQRVPVSVLKSVGAAWPLYAASQLIRTTSTSTMSIKTGGADASAVVDFPAATVDRWESVIDQALERQEEYVHDAVASAYGAFSRLQDPAPRMQRTLQGWRGLHPTRQQSNALLLGHTAFTDRRELFERMVRFLLSLLTAKDPSYSTVIEVRRNAVRSVTQALLGLQQSLESTLSPELGSKVLTTLLACLEDYTVDQRGDVGSWVRLAALTAIRTFVEVHANELGRPEVVSTRINQDDADRIMAGVLKQTVERIDAVREHAGQQLVAIRKCSPPLPVVAGSDLLALALPEGEEVRFHDGAWAFPRIISLLDVPPYRIPILRGVAVSVGSKSDMAQRTFGNSLLDWAIGRSGRGSLLLHELYGLAVANFGANATFIPALITATLLIEGGAGDDLSDVEDEALGPKFVRIATHNVDKMKSLPRVQASASLCVNLIRLPAARGKALEVLSLFLLHPFTAVRTSTAEELYLVLQDVVEDEIPEEAEDILLNTKWAHRVQKVQTAKLVDVLKSSLL